MSEQENPLTQPMQPVKPRRTRGKGRRINYWDDKAIDPPGKCILCGGETRDNSCKVKCRNCGYTRDCSDP